MANYFQLITALILLAEIQGGLSVPSPESSPLLAANTNDNQQMIDIGILLSRIDQLEAKVVKVDQHELRINSLEIEVDQLKKKNLELEEKNSKLILATADEKLSVNDDVTRREFVPRSCFEVKAANPNAQSGEYFIDPDGQIGGDEPFKVYCDMATKTTSIYHDTERKTNVTSCAEPGCYTRAISYSATLRQLKMLADISTSCKQYIRFDSLSVPLEFNSIQHGFWTDRNGGKQIFWAGPATSQHTCQCGLSNNCFDRTLKCNADSLAPVELIDEGFVTATELLPITKLNFGRTNLLGVKASYTLGRFECTGQAAISSKPTNCRDLFKMGHTLSGFYDVKSSSSQIASTYCDFSKASTETGYETRYGFVDVKSSPVHFFVTRTTSWSTPGTMPFEKLYLNLGGGMNLASGVFTVPKAGIYTFSFVGTGNESLNGYAGRGFVFLQRNGVDVAIGYSLIYGQPTLSSFPAFSVHATIKLNIGDTITIRLVGGIIFSNENSHIQFIGSLLEEDLVIS